MPRKPAIAKETAPSAKPVRVATSSTPRVKAAQHSKVVPAVEKIPQPVLAAPENAQEAIAKIAYGYWESRGCQGGNEIEDWVRAEHEYRQLTTTA